MPEGNARTEPESAQPGPPDDGLTPTKPLGRRVDAAWPVLVVPAVVIGLAAVAGYAFDELATLAVGVATAAILVGLLVYRILNRKRPWLVAVCVCSVALSVFGLGMLKVADIRQASTPPAAAAPSTTPPIHRTPPTMINAGRRFTQQDISRVTDFRGADLRGAQLIELDLRAIDFSGANAAGASFESSRLDRATFRGADLGGAVLRRTCLHNANFDGADLTGAVATDADVSGVNTARAETAVANDWPPPGSQSSACAQPRSR